MAKRVVVLIALVSASVFALPRPAEAAITWKLVTSTTTIAASEAKTVRLACPGGTFTVGGGVSISSYDPQVRLQSSHPFDGSDTDTAGDDGWVAMYLNASDRSRTITLSAVCASGLRVAYVKSGGYSLAGDGVRRVGYVGCPDGYHVLAGGARLGLGGTAGRYALTDFYPGRSVDTQDYDMYFGGAAGVEAGVRRTLTVYAVCSTHEPAVTSRSSSVGGSSATSSSSYCSTSQLATGGGVRLDSSNGLQNVLTATPRHTVGDSLPDGWSTLVVNKHSLSRPLTFFRICPSRT